MTTANYTEWIAKAEESLQTCDNLKNAALAIKEFILQQLNTTLNNANN